MHTRYTMRCQSTTLFAMMHASIAVLRPSRAAALLALLLAPLLRAEPPPPAPGNAEILVAVRQVMLAPPSPTEAMAAYRTLEPQVRELRSDGLNFISLPGTGSAVTLRLANQVLGRGSTLTLDPDTAGKHLRASLDAAIAEADTRLPGTRDALWPDTRRALAAELTIALEFAGDPTPITPKTWAEVLALVEPGVQGVAVRRANDNSTGPSDTIEAAFPLAMLASQTEPPAALQSLIAKLLNQPGVALAKTPAELAAEHNLVYYRFDVVQLVQPSPKSTPEFLHRGSSPIPITAIDMPRLQRWADALAANLRRPRGEQNRSPDLTGELLRIWALHEQARITQAASTAPQPPVKALLEGALAQPFKTNTEAALAIVVARRILPAPESLRLTRSHGQHLAKEGHGAPQRSALEWLAMPDASLAADVKWLETGYTEAHMLTRRRTEVERVSKFHPALWSNAGPANAVNLMPWIVLAELDRAATLGVEPAGPAEIPSAIAFRGFRGDLWQRQLRPESLTTRERDLAGAVRFAGEPLPTARLARPAYALALALADTRLTQPNEAPRETQRLLESLRFLRQLTVDESSVFLQPDTTTLGGVRASPWDQTVTDEATAMTLLAVCETLRALNALAERTPPQQPPNAPQQPAR